MDIEELQRFCLSLPAVSEDVKWENNLVFSVCGKMFCMYALDEPFKCSFKVAEEDFEEVSNTAGFMPSAYLARARWVTLLQPGLLHKQEWQQYLRQSYELVKAKLPKKVRQEWGL